MKANALWRYLNWKHFDDTIGSNNKRNIQNSAETPVSEREEKTGIQRQPHQQQRQQQQNERKQTEESIDKRLLLTSNIFLSESKLDAEIV